jgi:hypothetical protein
MTGPGNGFNINPSELEQGAGHMDNLGSNIRSRSNSLTSAHESLESSMSGDQSGCGSAFSKLLKTTKSVFTRMCDETVRVVEGCGVRLRTDAWNHRTNEEDIRQNIDNVHPNGPGQTHAHVVTEQPKPVAAPSTGKPFTDPKQPKGEPGGGSTVESSAGSSGAQHEPPAPPKGGEDGAPTAESSTGGGGGQFQPPAPPGDEGASTPKPKPKPKPKRGKGKGKATEPPADTTPPPHIVTDANGNQRLSNADKAEMEEKKFTVYALNPEHPVGGHKARVFASATGFTKDNAQDLMEQIQGGVTQNTPTPGKVDDWGHRYTVKIPVTGPTGSGTVTTGWIYKTGKDTPSLTTLLMEGKKK